MAFIGSFNANDIEPADFSAIPAGDYTALISSSEFRNTKSGDGQYLVLAFQIIDGQRKGRMLWHNLNLFNSNTKAVEIAQKELSAICRATGAMQIDNSEALHDRPMRITVDYIPAGNDKKGVYRDESNRIKKWVSLTAPATPAAAPAAPKAPPVAAAPRPASAPPTAAAAAPRPAAAPQKAPPPVAPRKKAPAAPVQPAESLDDDIEF